ncbi:RNA polymerase I-specific transcription initiation factor RRN6-like protein [Pseudomassariella vexata]|uniref:RNA polymerase I-specific transcription initiation factor RRN6-like protein n=1 Tax=Pseudomassariella vexata TaxID=1141098 RepID=A0A1Y2DZ71_9PEZI|nr:RNA polymerase I-specific transcription initiation factor RRN6-like protein [Pseudomassariella vexata]ORY64394.1 RNA polymerase I-specific transcription initiation factor RRN6-like protein [Pseudomassariella vexata]
MADQRTDSSSFGHPGRLTYFPYGLPKAEECGWQTARNHDPEAPRFQEIGPSQEWFPVSRSLSSSTTNETWRSTQRQSVWLLKNHPVAALGNGVLGEALSLANLSCRPNQSTPWQRSQLAVGEMADTSNPQKTGTASLVAMAAGPAGDVLRLVRPTTEYWKWDNDESVALRLSGHESIQQTLWTKDIGTIRQISAVVNTKRFEPVRWLVVQRDWGTSVFQPEYQKAPVVSESVPAAGSREPSRIAPNPLFTLLRKHTGCDFHSDASFNPSIRSKPSQLAIIDEGGNWTIWDITRIRSKASNRPQLRLHKYGSIQKGLREQLSHKPATDPQSHRILWVGSSAASHDDWYDSDDEDDAESQFNPAFPPLQRSSTLLLCNSKAVRLFDLDTDSFLPDLEFIPEGSVETILDVQINVQDPRYVFVATTSKVCVMGILSSSDPTLEKGEKRALVLHSFPHMRDSYDQNLKLSVTSGPRHSSDHRLSLVFMYSEGSSWFDIFYFSMSKKRPDQVSCYRDTMVSEGVSNAGTGRSLQKLHIIPTAVTAQREQVPTAGARLLTDQRVRYYQMFSLGIDLSLSCSLGACLSQDWNQTLIPNRKVAKKLNESERRKLIRYLGSRFVVPDQFAGFYNGSNVTNPKCGHIPRTTFGQSHRRLIRGVYEHLQNISEEAAGRIEGTPLDMEIFGAAPFDPVYVTVETALETGILPSKTLCEIMHNLKVPRDMDAATFEWQEEIDRLEPIDPALKVMSLAGPRRGGPESSSLYDIFTRLLDVVSDAMQSAVVSELHKEVIASITRRIACELYLSRFSMMFRPMDLFRSRLPESLNIGSPTNFSDAMLIDSQPGSQPSSPASSTFSGVTKSEPAEDVEDRSLALIRVYTGSGTSVTAKKSELLSTWIEGDDPAKYVFSLDKSAEVTPGIQRRAKQQAREAKKRKRVESIRKRLEERDLNHVSSTQPAVSNRFSQVSQPLNEFSQPWIGPQIAMSQPTAGAFGSRSLLDRPNKRVKRKGGFR